MKKGLRFQTRLMLTLGGTIAGVTIALVAATEAKVREAYTQQFDRMFSSRIGDLQRSRKERTGESLELSRTLANHPFVVASLKDDATEELERDFWEFYRESVEPGSDATGRGRLGKGQKIPADFFNRFGMISILTPEGSETVLFHPKIPEEAKQRVQRFNFRRRGAEERVKQFLLEGKQQVVYEPFSTKGTGTRGGGESLREVIATPVADPATGRNLGIFLRRASAETDAQRFLERYQEEFSGSAEMLEGIYMEGKIYSRSLSAREKSNIEEALSGKLTSLETRFPEGRGTFGTSIEEEPFLVHLDLLTSGNAFRPAYQVAAFPLAPLRKNIRETRLRGSGIGATVLLLALGLGWFLARNLSRPLHNLTRGTDAIRSGDFDYRVEVTSSDEIGELASSFNEMAEELKQKAHYRELLGKVSDETVAQALISGALDLELGGEIKTASVLFCDIRGFTQMTEHMHPTEVITMLNNHMTAMTEVVRRHFGVVDKFVGDEIMALFGGLKSYGNDAHLAASCACEMIAERKRINRESGQAIEIGVGVATGEVVAGCMGSVDRLNFTVLGARVNLAARLCSRAQSMEVVVDDATFAQLDPGFLSEEMTDLQLKGFSSEVSAYRIRSEDEMITPSAT